MTSDGPGSRLSETVGLKLNDGSFEPLIAAGTALPADAMKRFTTAEDNQTQVQIRVFQGSDATAERNDLLGECTLAGIPPAPAGTPGIEVLFSIDEDGSLEVSAQENASGHGQEVKADAGTSLDDVNVEQARSGSDKILGIDLGTTNSAFAVMEGGDPEIIVNDEGDRTTPSVVAFSDGERLVGKPAKNRAVQNPDDTVESIKRHMSEEDYTVELGGDSYTPEQVSAMILQKIKRDAEDYLGDEIDKTVITVPAYFSDHQRQAIKDAGEIAGFDVERMINEPTAASIAYGLNDESDQTVLVYDLGGGSFSLSILELGGGVYEVVATNGDNDLGGDDWDRAIIDWLAEDFYNEHGIDLREDRQALQRLTEAAEEAKIELSNRTETTITLPFIAAADDGPRNLEASLTRAKFESMTRNLVERTVEPTEQALDEIPSRISIDEVVLVGGSTRMPQVRKKIEELTGQEPQKNVNPDEAVALGAAIQGGVLSGDVEDIILLDVTPLSLGVETEGGLFERLIDKNTTIPTVESDVFTTSEDGQTRIRIRVFQGEREIAEENELLGAFTLAGIPPAPAGEPRIEVTLSIDEDGIVNVEAEDRGSGTSENITIEGDTVTESGGSGDGEASDAARPAMAEETETGGSGSEKRIAPDTLEELIERALSVRDELHRGRLYCRRSEDHGIADIRDNLENTVEKIRDVTGSSPAGRGSESESSSKRLRTTLESVSETLEESVGEPVSASWSVEDLDVVIGELDGALVDVGLELIDPDPGDETDPYRHHALSSTESSLPEGTVASVQQVGYERDGQVRQEARVIVSSGGAPESSGDTDLEIREEKIPDIERFGSPPRASLTHGDIEVGRLLGSGGQASVYEATVPALETPSRIALKKPAHGGRTLTEETVASFFERARTWRTVDDRERNKRRWDSYEHVVGVVDVGHQRPWIALEYMDGGSLGDRLDGSPDGLPVGEAVWIAHCLCKALEVAHSYGIAHLDLKPDNVLFAETGSGRWDVPKLADWGLARKLAEGTGSMEALSPTYAAPEQFEPQDFGDPDSITDVYQVGANLYAMLTGEPPATGSHLAVMTTVLNNDPPAPPSDKGSNAPPGLNDIVLRALATRKRDRYESIRYFRDDLEAILGDV